MNALANDPLDRLRDMLGGTGIPFGQWVGTTPGTESEVTLDHFPGCGRAAYLAERKKRREEAQAEDRAVRPLAPPEECCSEEDIRQRKPRILLTNYRQLEVLTTRLPDVALFAEAPIEYLVFDFVKGPKNVLRGFEHGNATQDDDDKDNAVWSAAPAENGTRLVLTNRLLEEADGGPTPKSTRWPKAWFCRQCGAMRREPADRCLADGCGHKEPLLPPIAFGLRLSACPSCSSASYRIG